MLLLFNCPHVFHKSPRQQKYKAKIAPFSNVQMSSGFFKKASLNAAALCLVLVLSTSLTEPVGSAPVLYRDIDSSKCLNGICPLPLKQDICKGPKCINTLKQEQTCVGDECRRPIIPHSKASQASSSTSAGKDILKGKQPYALGNSPLQHDEPRIPKDLPSTPHLKAYPVPTPNSMYPGVEEVPHSTLNLKPLHPNNPSQNDASLTHENLDRHPLKSTEVLLLSHFLIIVSHES